MCIFKVTVFVLAKCSFTNVSIQDGFVSFFSVNMGLAKIIVLVTWKQWFDGVIVYWRF